MSRQTTSVDSRRLVTPDLRIGSRAADLGRQRGPRVLDKGQSDWRVHVGVGERGSSIARGSDTGKQFEMTRQETFKRRIRERMEKTESGTAQPAVS